MAENNKSMKFLKLPIIESGGYDSAHMGQCTDPDLPMTGNATIKTNNTGVGQRKALKMNAIAVCNFTMLFTT
eukprot:1414845-Ditylum_brightwellii.AAC.1